MSYITVVQIANDKDFIDRLTACAATELIDNPISWARVNLWALAATVGFAEAYESALAAGYANPGRRHDVISDQMILSGVQAFMSRAGQ